MNRAWIGLGSNLGPRRRILERAFQDLARLPETRLLRRSSLHEFAHFGRDRQPDYLNAAALLATGLSPMGLLVHLKRLEWRAGRRPGRKWAPRRLDLDLLFYGTLRRRGPFLTLPHPGARGRNTVRVPLREIPTMGL